MVLGGIGFTLILLITNLAFVQIDYINPAKIGILAGSLISGMLGYIILNRTLPKNPTNGYNETPEFDNID